MIITHFEQGSPDWHHARCGKRTASRFADCLAVKPEGWACIRESGDVAKKFATEAEAHAAAAATRAIWRVEKIERKPTEAYETYLIEQAEEIVTGRFDDAEGWSNFWTERGLELEPVARQAYEIRTGLTSTTCGLILTDDEQLGASVDGLVDDDPEGPGQNEIKCFKRSNHAKIVLADQVPDDILIQVQGQLYVTGRAWCDFISYHPDGHVPLYVKRVYRDEAYHQRLAAGLASFTAELDALVAKMRAQMIE